MVKITEDYIRTLISKKSFNDENFPVSSFLIDSEKAEHVRNFYHFARISDDIADNMLLNLNNLLPRLKYILIKTSVSLEVEKKWFIEK